MSALGRFCTSGNLCFVIGCALEGLGLRLGVHSQVVGLGMVFYGVLMIVYAYLR